MTMWVIIFMHKRDSVTNFTYMLLQKAWMSMLSYIILQKDKSKCWDVHWVSNLITICELKLVEVIALSVFLIVLFWVSVAADKDFIKALSKERFYELVILYFEGLLTASIKRFMILCIIYVSDSAELHSPYGSAEKSTFLSSIINWQSLYWSPTCGCRLLWDSNSILCMEGCQRISIRINSWLLIHVLEIFPISMYASTFVPSVLFYTDINHLYRTTCICNLFVVSKKEGKNMV